MIFSLLFIDILPFELIYYFSDIDGYDFGVYLTFSSNLLKESNRFVYVLFST